MNDAEYAAQVARLLALAEQWVRPIGLGWWRVIMEYDRTGEEFDAAPPHWQRLAVCRADWRYTDAKIIWNMRAVADADDDDLERNFVHELMHVFLHELRGDEPTQEQHDHEERVATTLAKGFLWIRDRARDGEWGKVEP